MSKLAIIVEFCEYVGARKKWWVLPLLLFLILLAALIALSQNPAVAPFLYALW